MSPLRAKLAGALLLLPSLVACGGDDGPPPADLPGGWESAERVAQLIQLECAGSPYDNPNEGVTVEGGAGKLGIDYQEAHFRCAQDVEGFFREAGPNIDVLVQPIDMNPDMVTACDCLYDITILLDPVASGTHEVTVYRRWDNLNDPNEPVRIGGGPAEVQ